MAGADVPVWIAAVSATSALIGTAASAAYQGRQFRDQRKLLRHQAGLLELQAQELRDATSHRLAEQAVLVQLEAWKSRLVPRIGGDQPPTAVLFPPRSDQAAVISSALVVNKSERPIRDVQVRFDSTDARWVRIREGAPARPTPLPGLGGAHSAWFDSDYQQAYIGSVTLLFTDVHGISWQTDMAGYVERIRARDW